MVFKDTGIDKYVIQIYQCYPLVKASKYALHQSLETARGITKSKWHDIELEQPGMCDKGYLLARLLVHLNLPVTRH